MVQPYCPHCKDDDSGSVVFGARGLFPNDFGLHLECSHFEVVLFRGYNLEGNYTAEFESIWKGVEALLGRITKEALQCLEEKCRADIESVLLSQKFSGSMTFNCRCRLET